jgi:uncharacterized protein (TIGR00661 family)
MKYLFIVQGEGRGHLTQAIAMAQMLRRNGHEVPEVLVGKNPNRILPGFFEEKIDCPVRTFDSPSFDYGKGGKKGNIPKTILANTTPKRLARWGKSISKIARCIEECRPDAVVNFYEILLGITGLVHRLRVPVISVGHQFLVDHPDYAHGSKTDQGQFALRLNNALCSLGTTKTLALSFYPLKDFYRQRMAVVPPLLRQEVFELEPSNEGYILSYVLNVAYADELRAWHKKHPEQKLHLFWDKKDAPDVLEVDDTLTIHRLDDRKFLTLMSGCAGYATTAGFESVCEAMYLGKPALMVPAHVEQEINAEDAAGIGAGITVKDFDLSQLVDFSPRYDADTEGFRRWVASAEELFVRHLTTLV